MNKHIEYLNKNFKLDLTYMNMCICIYMYTYMYIHVYVYMCMYVYMRMYVHVCVYMCVHVHMCVHVCVYICIYNPASTIKGSKLFLKHIKHLKTNLKTSSPKLYNKQNSLTTSHLHLIRKWQLHKRVTHLETEVDTFK